METILSYVSHSTLKECHNVTTLGLHELNSNFVILNHRWVILSNEIKSFGEAVSFFSFNHLHYMISLYVSFFSNFTSEENTCIPQPSLIDLMAKVIVKLDQMSNGQKKILSKLKLSKKDTEELLRGQKRLEKLIEDK